MSDAEEKSDVPDNWGTSRFDDVDPGDLPATNRTEEDMSRVSHPGKATDAAWKLAREYGLCISLIDGTGQDGKVLKGDVEDALEVTRKKLKGADDE